MRLSDELLRIAGEISPQVRLTFSRSSKVEDKDYNSIHFEIQRFVDTVRRNEELQSVVERIDDDEEMVLLIGVSDHEEREAIVRELGTLAKKLARKFELKVKVE